ncbi:hypothetical protein HPB47_024623 [Ixodes persulcatus]|uniref:Uncharacterized protein n=1 Tax=Ixodes persulcatus TaxID=34615 RepID=A0AC60Q641_IXOPE|nr:hypothetical protein HPB47_024623 [Ixodes persulcatus]
MSAKGTGTGEEVDDNTGRTRWLDEKTFNQQETKRYTFLGGASLPDEVRATLDRVRKFAFEPQLPPTEKLFLVRGLAERALPQDRERCIADGVDALCRTAGQRPKTLKMWAIVDHLKCANLKLLTSDKEGRFVVLPRELYTKKAKKAVDKNFKLVKPGSLNKVKDISFPPFFASLSQGGEAEKTRGQPLHSAVKDPCGNRRHRWSQQAARLEGLRLRQLAQATATARLGSATVTPPSARGPKMVAPDALQTRSLGVSVL